MAKKLPKIISQDEFEKIFKACRNKKVKLAMLLGFEAGLRISEVVGLKKNDEWVIEPLTKDRVDMKGNKINIFGKGSKERVVPLPKRFSNTAYNMLPLKLKRRTLQDNVTKLGEKHLGKKISFHTLRHGFGSHLAGNNVPLHQVQMLMGHSRLDTTGIYLHANPKKALEEARDVF